MRRVVRPRAVVLAVALVLGGCSSCGKSAPKTDAGTTAHGLTPEQSAQVLARVGDRTLTLGEYVAVLEHMDQFDRMRYHSAERRKELLHEMTDVLLLADEARAKGYDKDPITQQEIREILRDAMLKKAHEGVPAPNEVPDEQVRVYFETHRGDFRDPERRRVAAIVLATEAAARVALDAARKSSPAQWGEIVRAKSTDPQANTDVPSDLAGDFGFVGPTGDSRGDNPRVPAEVRAAIYEIANVGEVLPRVVRGANGKFYVVKLAAKTDAHDRTLQEAERTIRVKLTQDKMREKEKDLLDELGRQFPVTIDENALARVHVDVPPADAGR
jgi:DNA-directed RNA polymerase subunit F